MRELHAGIVVSVTVCGSLGDAFAETQRGDALVAPQPLDHDPNLLFG
jgi:hypothetical protein